MRLLPSIPSPITFCLRSVLFAALFAALISSCATERYVSPALSDGPRTGLHPRQPVLAAVLDARPEPMPQNAAAELQADLTRIYGSSFEWAGTAAATPPGRVSIRIHIIAFGAYYGKRFISTKEYTDALTRAHEKATDTWEPVLGSIAGQNAVLAGSLPAEGWWNGIARIDLEIEDTRGAVPIRFILPVAGEHREAGRGSSSGDLAALEAWERTAPRLLAALDAVFGVLQDEQR